MGGLNKITLILLLIQLHLVHCQRCYRRPYNGRPILPYGPVPSAGYEPPLPYPPEVIDTPVNPNQPNIIIIRDDDGGPSRDGFGFEELLTLLLTTSLERDRDAPPPPQYNQESSGRCCCCNCGCCCGNNNRSNNDRNNRCSCCGNSDNDNGNGPSNNGNGRGSTVHITIVLPNNMFCKNDRKL